MKTTYRRRGDKLKATAVGRHPLERGRLLASRTSSGGSAFLMLGSQHLLLPRNRPPDRSASCSRPGATSAVKADQDGAQSSWPANRPHSAFNKPRPRRSRHGHCRRVTHTDGSHHPRGADDGPAPMRLPTRRAGRSTGRRGRRLTGPETDPAGFGEHSRGMSERIRCRRPLRQARREEVRAPPPARGPPTCAAACAGPAPGVRDPGRAPGRLGGAAGSSVRSPAQGGAAPADALVRRAAGHADQRAFNDAALKLIDDL